MMMVPEMLENREWAPPESVNVCISNFDWQIPLCRLRLAPCLSLQSSSQSAFVRAPSNFLPFALPPLQCTTQILCFASCCRILLANLQQSASFFSFLSLCFTLFQSAIQSQFKYSNKFPNYAFISACSVHERFGCSHGTQWRLASAHLSLWYFTGNMSHWSVYVSLSVSFPFSPSFVWT